MAHLQCITDIVVRQNKRKGLYDMTTCNKKLVITIGRTFGSGGREIGKKVAAELKIPFYDKELLEVAAKESGGAFFPEYLSRFDEKNVSGFLLSMALNPYYVNEMPVEMMILEMQMRALEAVASQGPCVIVGRRADRILRHEFDTMSVFISASMEKRIARVSARDGLSEKESEKKIIKADKSRRAFYNSDGQDGWGEAANYNLCIDSGDLGVDNSAAMILHYLELKGKIVQD